MKKQLLSGIASLVCASLFAQSPIVIYNGTAGQLFNTTSAYDSAKVKQDTINGNAFLNIWGTANDTTLTVGTAQGLSYDVGNVLLPLGYTGTVANSVLKFKVSTNGTGAGLRIQFNTFGAIKYGYQWDTIPGADTGFYDVTIPLADFKTIVDGEITAVSIIDGLLSASNSQVEFVLLASDSGAFAQVYLDDVEIGNRITTDLSDVSISASATAVYPNPCQSGTLYLREQKQYTLMNSTGAVLSSGNSSQVDVSSLNPGVYYIKMDTDVQKVIIN